MNCPRCLDTTKVVDSRMPTKDSRGCLTKRGEMAFGWWCSDYRVRRRRCKKCELVFHTVEISIRDLNEAIRDTER